jgi:hypothetical protein
MEEDRMPKKIFTQELEGTRRRGRPRKRWKEEAERDLQVLGVRRWRELVTDRKKWKDIVRQAKTTAGCSANGRRREDEQHSYAICICVLCCATVLSVCSCIFPNTPNTHIFPFSSMFLATT